VSIGCIPLTDEYIKEIYLIATYAHSAGQEEIPVHIFPFNYAKPTYTKLLATYSNPVLKNFWYNLKDGFDYFQNKKLLPEVSVDEKGKYLFK
jgi:murein L,D-transpeptidase YafK